MDIEELQKRYDELDDMECRIDMLIDDIVIYQDFKEGLEILKDEIQKELGEIEPQLEKARDAEEEDLNREYWTSQF